LLLVRPDLDVVVADAFSLPLRSPPPLVRCLLLPFFFEGLAGRLSRSPRPGLRPRTSVDPSSGPQREVRAMDRCQQARGDLMSQRA